jgi:hypothetical protein
VTSASITWPEGKAFAFTVFDDTDLLTLDDGPPVYDFIAEQGFRTTKSVWPCSPGDLAQHQAETMFDFDITGSTCDEPQYLEWALDLQRRGFEIGFHNATYLSSRRSFTARALDSFRARFGHDPRTYATHFQCVEGMYWGSHRLTGLNRAVFDLLSRYRTRGIFQGHNEQSEYFWGDLCRDRIDYVRNFVFRDVNTFKMCPEMPYHDTDREYVRAWFASSEGGDVRQFNLTLSEANQDRLEREGGACIMYTHFAKGFWDGKRLDGTFTRLMKRLAAKNGWFVPVATLLDHLKQRNGIRVVTGAERAALERRWLFDKIRAGRGS